MSRDIYSATFHPSGKVTFNGVDNGPMTVHQYGPEIVVIKKAGHKYWGGIGSPQNYSPARFEVYEIEGDPMPTSFDSPVYRRISRIVAFPSR